MQKLTISQMVFSNELPVRSEAIVDIIKSRLNKSNIKIGEIKVVNGEIVLQSKDKLFVSKVENRIPLSPTDPRRKSLGRDYLVSTRLSSSQYNALFNALKEPFDDLGIVCDIIYMDDTKTEKWRSGKTTTFPTINTKMLPKNP